MKFADLLELTGSEPLFESALLLAGGVDAGDVRRQLSRWTAQGKVVQLRRGLYALAPPYARVAPHPFVVANRLVRPSYVSTESVLASRGMIPEHVPVTTSVTTGRSGLKRTPLGAFLFRHVMPERFTGYRREEVARGQHAFVATPEKALLDLVYLRAGADRPEFLEELRLDGLEQLDRGALREEARRAGSPKLVRAAAWLADRAAEDAGEHA
jgi:predicted transcriptional regulator of viral defense system